MKENISSRAGDRKIVIKVERERVQFGECYAGVLIVFASESKGRETCDDHLIQICYFTDEMDHLQTRFKPFAQSHTALGLEAL